MINQNSAKITHPNRQTLFILIHAIFGHQTQSVVQNLHCKLNAKFLFKLCIFFIRLFQIKKKKIIPTHFSFLLFSLCLSVACKLY